MRALAGSIIAILTLSGCSNQAAQEVYEPTTLTTNAASVFDTKWPSNLTREIMVEAALGKAKDFFKQRDTSGQSLIYIDEAVGQSNIDWIEELSKRSTSAFEDYLDDDFALVVGLDGEYLNKTIAENNLTNFDNTMCQSIAEETWVAGCGVSHLAWVGFGPTKDTGELGVSQSIRSVIPHELFHSVQDSLYPESGTLVAGKTKSLLNAWLLEGTAEFMGYATLDSLGLADYSVSYLEPWYYLPDPSTGLKYHELGTGSLQVPPEHYWMGQMATEYIVANTSVDSLIKIWSGLGEGKDWEQSFYDAIGITLEEFYIKFDKAYANIYSANKNIKTFENIDYCPEVWDCSGELTQETSELDWWKEAEVSVDLPSEAENSDHGLPLDPGAMPPDLSCADINNWREWESGIASSFESKGSSSAHVSTQWYVFYQHLDVNKDGVACNSPDR